MNTPRQSSPGSGSLPFPVKISADVWSLSRNSRVKRAEPEGVADRGCCVVNGVIMCRPRAGATSHELHTPARVQNGGSGRGVIGGRRFDPPPLQSVCVCACTECYTQFV